MSCESSNDAQQCRGVVQRQPSTVKKTVKPAVEVRRFQRRALRRREYEGELGRLLAGHTALEQLAIALFAARGDYRGRERQRPGASLRLGFDEAPIAVDALKGMGHAQRAHVEVDVLPAESEQLALAQPGKHGGCEQRPQTVVGSSGVIQEKPCLLYREPFCRSSLRSGRIDQSCDVSVHQSPFERVTECATQHGARVLHGPRRKTCGGHLAHHLNMLSRQLAELMPIDARHDVEPHELRVAMQ